MMRVIINAVSVTVKWRFKRRKSASVAEKN